MNDNNDLSIILKRYKNYIVLLYAIMCQRKAGVWFAFCDAEQWEPLQIIVLSLFHWLASKRSKNWLIRWASVKIAAVLITQIRRLIKQTSCYSNIMQVHTSYYSTGKIISPDLRSATRQTDSGGFSIFIQHSKPSCLFVSFWYERKCSFQCPIHRISSSTSWYYKALMRRNAQKETIRKSSPLISNPHQMSPFKKLHGCCIVFHHSASLCKTGCRWAEVPPGMFYLYEVRDVHRIWRHIHACWAHKTLLVGLKLFSDWETN